MLAIQLYNIVKLHKRIPSSPRDPDPEFHPGPESRTENIHRENPTYPAPKPEGKVRVGWVENNYKVSAKRLGGGVLKVG